MKVNILALALFLILAGTLSTAYSISDCNEIGTQIKAIEATKSNYDTDTVYAFYARLGDKYNQLGECYQDIGQDASQQFSESGKYYKLAGDAYFATPDNRYMYYVSCGDAYASAGNKGAALSCFSAAKEIIDEHPDIHVNPAYIKQRISELETPLGKTTVSSNWSEYIGWGVGILIIIGIIGGIAYIVHKY